MSLREFREHIKVACEWCAEQDDIKSFSIKDGIYRDGGNGFTVFIEWKHDALVYEICFSRSAILATKTPETMITADLLCLASKARMPAQSAAPAPQTIFNWDAIRKGDFS